MRERNQHGTSLLEIVIAMVLIALTFGALLAGLNTATRSSSSQRKVVNADLVLRSWAEATKNAVRTQCNRVPGNSGATFTVFAPAGVPAGYTVTVSPTVCPDKVTDAIGPGHNSAPVVTISITAPVTKTLQIRVRLP